MVRQLRICSIVVALMLVPASSVAAGESLHPTETSLECPRTAILSNPSSETIYCTATVTDISPDPSSPTRIVTFSTDGAIISGFCNLIAISTAGASCRMSYSPGPGSLGRNPVTATYGGDDAHAPSTGATTITVLEKATDDGPSANGSTENIESPPSTYFEKHPLRRSMMRKAKFAFNSNGEGIYFECRLGDRAFKNCSSPLDMRVGLGAHTFSVRAVTATGLADLTPAVFRWHV